MIRSARPLKSDNTRHPSETFDDDNPHRDFKTEILSLVERLKTSGLPEPVTKSALEIEAEKARVRRLALYRFVRKVEHPHSSQQMSDLTVKRPITRSDILTRNIAAQEGLTADKVAKRRQDIFKIREERLQSAKQRLSLLRLEEEELRKSIYENSKAKGDSSLVAGKKFLVLCSALSFAVGLNKRLIGVRASGKILAESATLETVISPTVLCTSEVESQFVRLQRIVRSRIMRRHIREEAGMAWKFLSAWQRSGPLIIAMKRFHSTVRRLQTFWRNCRIKLRTDLEIVSLHWLTLETEILNSELGCGGPVLLGGTHATRRPSLMRTGSSLVGGVTSGLTAQETLKLLAAPSSVTVSDKIAFALIPESKRKEFLAKKLRTMRVHYLVEQKLHRANVKVFWKRVAEWRADRAALKLLGLPGTPFTLNFPVLITYLPSDEEVAVLISECRGELRIAGVQ